MEKNRYWRSIGIITHTYIFFLNFVVLLNVSYCSQYLLKKYELYKHKVINLFIYVKILFLVKLRLFL